MLQGKILVFYATVGLLRSDLLTSIETRDSLFWTNESELSLAYTDIFVSLLYRVGVGHLQTADWIDKENSINSDIIINISCAK